MLADAVPLPSPAQVHGSVNLAVGAVGAVGLDDLVDGMSGIAPRSLRALVVLGDRAALVGPDQRVEGSLERLLPLLSALERDAAPRWVWWDAHGTAAPLVARGLRPARCWDVAEAHRLLVGGPRADPAAAVAVSRGLPVPDPLPVRADGDLFDFVDRERVPSVGPPAEGSSLLPWADLAMDTARRQAERLATVSPRAVTTATSESAAALLAVELEADGLPIDRPVLEELVAAAAGPRPVDDAQAAAIRGRRDECVLRHVPGRASTDLRNPVQVRELLAAVGVVVPDTRAWRLEPFRAVHPVVEALLAWRKAERIATTYGYAWMRDHIGPDDRLRGAWTSCDGAAGRMTAQSGLHNLPAPLRPAVAAHPGHVLVRADLGQIEPRVLAAVSGDRRFAEAAGADDLYAPVAAALGVERPVAKVAVLAAMYGQTSGAAGEALKRLERSYPTAMAYLQGAYDAGTRGRAVRTFGGRRVPTRPGDVAVEVSDGIPEDLPAGVRAARGRFARNAVIQGAAAELFKAWAATVRAALPALEGQIVLCLHDELLLHVPSARAADAVAVVGDALAASARRWTGSDAVRFVADTKVIRRWSEAKD